MPGLPLRTERLEIRAFVEEDLEALHRVYGDPEVTRFIPRYPTVDDTRRALNVHVSEARAGHPAFWALIERQSGELIGDAGLGLLAGGPDHELGYTLARNRWGQGYATEAAGACLAYALGQLGLDPVYAQVRPENTASVRVLEKIGMEPAGRRDAYGAPHLIFVARAPATRR